MTRTTWPGFYLDGRQAERQAAEVRLTPDGLEVLTQRGLRARWAYGDLRQTQGFYPGEQVRLEPRAGGEAVVVPADAFLIALRQVGGARARHFHDPGRRWLRGPAAVAAALAVLGLAGAAYVWVIPAAASALAPRVPVAWEERVGQGVLEYLAPSEERCEDPPRGRALDAIVATLAATVPETPYRFRVVVVDDPAVNALAGPGGYVVVYRGLLERTESAEELAGVLAHELQHVLRRHVARAVVQHTSTGLLLAGLTGDASGGVALEVARVLGQLRYGRQHEREADAEGLRMLVAAGIDPAGMIRFFETLNEAEPDDQAPALLDYLSTHPAGRERLETLRGLAAAAVRPAGKLLPAYDWTDVRRLCLAARGGAPVALDGRGRVYLAPLGPLPPETVERLVTYYSDRFGLQLETLPGAPLDPDAIDPGRGQLAAEEAIALLGRRHPTLAADPEAILIGITAHDMYIRSAGWRFAFAYRIGDRLAVVSTARLDPASYGAPPDPGLFEARLRKMVAKQIGLLHLRLPETREWGSVMHGPVRGLDDLDEMGEDF